MVLMLIPNTFSELGLFGNLVPQSGSRTIGPFVFDWTTPSYAVNLRGQQASNTNLIDFVASAYIDNGANTSPVILTMGTGQKITFPAKSQGYLVVYQNNPVQFTAASASGAGFSTSIMFSNVAHDMLIWPVA